MKRKFSIILVLALFISLFAIPTNAQAAVAISKKKATMELDSTLTIKVSGLAKGTSVAWTSNKTSIATVGKTTGTITAKKVGTATITGTAKGKKYTCTVTVVDSNKATPTATPKPTNKALSFGDTFTFDELEITLSKDIEFITIDNEYSFYYCSTVIQIPVTIKNLKSKTHGLNMFYYSIYGPKGTAEVGAYFDNNVDWAEDIQSGATQNTYFHVLYEGNGDYYIEFSDWSNKLEIKLPIKK